ncbi:phage holin [Streptococcus orisratti]|uniref:phage holin n=1 Tax=Streptococcus orisratti TaxID=114652 RepID=UPI0023F6CE5E|nr:phage holin [Streptococcus orisratti]
MKKIITKVDAGTLTRTLLIIIALINQGLVVAGKNTLPFTDDQVTQAISFAFTTVTSLAAWWKNNNFTNHAKEAQKYSDALKIAKKVQNIAPAPAAGVESKDDSIVMG